MVPGCSPGTYPVEGSCCWGTERGVAAGSGPEDSWGPEVPVISVSALGPLASCLVAAMCLPWLGGPWAAGEVAPSLLAQGLGRPQAPFVACPRRVVHRIVGWPLTLGGRRRTSWMLLPPPGWGPREALPVVCARLA